ncbi:hypothetical protein HQO82_13695 [Rhodococcus fascians]|nr:hypothetical protein [Rhodococcus fascians]MBY4114876.1 hypothetical protein [Rhodococcus fascians]
MDYITGAISFVSTAASTSGAIVAIFADASQVFELIQRYREWRTSTTTSLADPTDFSYSVNLERTVAGKHKAAFEFEGEIEDAESLFIKNVNRAIERLTEA